MQLANIITLRVSDEQNDHLEAKRREFRCENRSEYIRQLINQDMEQSELEFNIKETVKEVLRNEKILDLKIDQENQKQQFNNKLTSKSTVEVAKKSVDQMLNL